MYRYVALSWNSKDLARTKAAKRLARVLLSSSPDWESVLDVSGMQVFQVTQPGGACHAYALKHGAGVVLGKLFHSELNEDSIPSDPTFDDNESKQIVESQGRRLVERYWGHYVAFLQASDGEQRFIFRDPTGGLPCFLTNTAGIDVVLSDMEDCVRLNLPPLSVDWNHLSAFFQHCRLVTRTTGFREVTQLYAGECLAIESGRRTRSSYWNPVDIYRANTIEEPAKARAALRTAVRHCISAWARCYDSIVHELSGGLDSSIIAACLAKARIRPEVLCFHYFTEMSEGDERSYAQAAAHCANFELIERKICATETTLESQLNRAKLATPALLGLIPESELLKQRLVTQRQAGAVFSGRGGDHLFQQGSTKLVAAEYAQLHGIRPQFLNVVADTSRQTQHSVWSVLGTAVSYGLLGRSFDPYRGFETPPILTDYARSLAGPEVFTHPWVESAFQLPASKIDQVRNIVDCQPFNLMPCPYAEQVHPLISQPIIECCLQIPTYVLACGGRDRGLVRDAFATELPTKVVHRHSKGGTTSYFNRMLVENAPFLRSFLLDGVLVSEGILDRRKLEAQLSESELVRGNSLQSILLATRAEAWLSTWADVRQRTAA